MTAWGSVELAVEAMRRGARDFVQKPWENARLLAIVRTQVELGQALRHGQRLEAENRCCAAAAKASPTLIAQSPAMQPVLQMISRVGPSDANVLITGENGTGKGVVARALHAVSAAPAKPMVTVNAGGLSEGVFESELFGHVKGAFTDAKTDRVGRFELADGGTLFLDEIANVPLSQQTKLLRVLETGEFERVGSSQHAARQRAPASPPPTPILHEEVAARPVPPGSALPPEYHRDPPARRCASAARTSRRSPRTSCSITRGATARSSPASIRPRCRRCSSTPGRATSASSITRSNAPC